MKKKNSPGPVKPRWGSLVTKMRQADSDDLAEFETAFGVGIRFLLRRHLSPREIDKGFLSCFKYVRERVQTGYLPNIENLPQLVYEGVSHVQLTHIDRHPQAAPPDKSAGAHRAETGNRVLKTLPLDRQNALIRFYALGESAEVICTSLHISRDELRTWKAEARSLFRRAKKDHPVEVARRPPGRALLYRFLKIRA